VVLQLSTLCKMHSESILAELITLSLGML